MNRVEFGVPKGMSNSSVAHAFAAYLQGPSAFENLCSRDGELSGGPYRKNDSDLDWQLDRTNDFWLHLHGQTGELHCRYDGGLPVIQAAVALFNARYARQTVRSAA